MKNILSSFIKEFIKVVIIVAVAVPTIALFAAWTGPTGAPPTNNADAPVNVGPFDQIKTGGWLSLSNLISRGTTLLAKDDGNVGIGQKDWLANPPTEKLDVEGFVKGQTGLCIGDDCRMAWPSAPESSSPFLFYSGNASISYRDYGGDHEFCKVDINIPGFCVANGIQSPVHSHWDDGLCKDWVVGGIKDESLCGHNFSTPLYVDWALNGSDGRFEVLSVGLNIRNTTAYSGNASISYRDYGGDHEFCKVDINIPGFCVANGIQSPVHGHWDDGLCKNWVKSRLATKNLCASSFPPFSLPIGVDWALSGNGGPLNITVGNP